MKENISEMKKYNHQVAAKLKEVFTPLTEDLQQKIENINAENMQQFLADIKVNLINYRQSQYDTYTQAMPTLNSDQLNSLKTNELSYFNSFLKHLNETAVLKPYNLSELLTGQFADYLWAPTYTHLSEANNHAADTLVIPVSEYGVENAFLMMLTTLVLLRMVDTLQDKGLDAELAHWSLLSAETLRGRKRAEQLAQGKTDVVLSSLDTLKEGIQSFQATLSTLTARKVGNMSFDCLLEQIINEKLPQKIALKVPFSYTLPSVRQGIFFEGVFNQQAGAEGKLTLSNAYQEYCKETQELYRNSRVYADGSRNPGLLGTGCPIAQKMSGYELIGINYIGKAYLQIFNLLKANLNLQEYKQLIQPLTLAPAAMLAQSQEKPDACQAYRVNKEERARAKEKVVEVMELETLADDVLRFWFGQLPVNEMPEAEIRDRWFMQSAAFDQEISQKYAAHIDEIKAGKFLHCKRTPMQTLALIIVLDQFSRNAFRNTAAAYASDDLAVRLCLEMIEAGQDLALPPACRWFLYMPLQHSENPELQEKSVVLFAQLLKQANESEDTAIFTNVLKNAEQHRDIIKHFGRFPYRNKFLQRSSTVAEKAYLETLPQGEYYNQAYFAQLATAKPENKAIQSSDYSKATTAVFACLCLAYSQQRNDNNPNQAMTFLLLLMLAATVLFPVQSVLSRFSLFKKPEIAPAADANMQNAADLNAGSVSRFSLQGK